MQIITKTSNTSYDILAYRVESTHDGQTLEQQYEQLLTFKEAGNNNNVTSHYAETSTNHNGPARNWSFQSSSDTSPYSGDYQIGTMRKANSMGMFHH